MNSPNSGTIGAIILEVVKEWCDRAGTSKFRELGPKVGQAKTHPFTVCFRPFLMNFCEQIQTNMDNGNFR